MGEPPERFFAVFGGMNASASLEAETEKLKAQTRPCRSHAVRRVSFVPLSLFILLSFELSTLSFAQFIPPKTAGNHQSFRPGRCPVAPRWNTNFPKPSPDADMMALQTEMISFTQTACLCRSALV